MIFDDHHHSGYSEHDDNDSGDEYGDDHPYYGDAGDYCVMMVNMDNDYGDDQCHHYGGDDYGNDGDDDDDDCSAGGDDYGE